MKNVLLWIASIFSMILDAVKKSKLDTITVQVPMYKICDDKINIELKGEKTMIVITSSIKNVRAYRLVTKYAEDHNLNVIGSYIQGSKRHFLLAPKE